MYDKNFISVTSHALESPPLSQTVTPFQTPSPSSVTYFMDGPIGALEKLRLSLSIPGQILLSPNNITVVSGMLI